MDEQKLSISNIRTLKTIKSGISKIIPEFFSNGAYGFYIMQGKKKHVLYKKTIAFFESVGIIEKGKKIKDNIFEYKITKAGMDIVINQISPGGVRPNSGNKKLYPDHVSMEVRLPAEDKIKIKAKYGRSFNEVFRAWVKGLIS